MIILAQVKNEIMLQQVMSTWKNFVRNKKNYTINHRRIEKKIILSESMSWFCDTRKSHESVSYENLRKK